VRGVYVARSVPEILFLVVGDWGLSVSFSTMQEAPLTILSLFRHGAAVYGDSEIVTFQGGGEENRRVSYRDLADRVTKLSSALHRLGVGTGDRVASFAWNNQEHMESYLAVPSMGAVLHTLNIRLFPEQLAYVMQHAGDKVVIVDSSLLPILAKAADGLAGVTHVIVVGDGDATELGVDVLRYDELLAAEEPEFAWPDLAENAPASMCYTSGTTGNPKGVVYSHRSTWLHSLSVTSGACMGLHEHDRILPIVPMFHANAWGLPYAGWMVGADFILTDRHLQAAPLTDFMQKEKPTVAGAVPTIWNDLLHFTEGKDVDFSSLRLVICGGSAVPASLMRVFDERFAVPIVQAWGMTETSPLAAVARVPKGVPDDEAMAWRTKAGRVCAGVELRIVSDAGEVLPWDGESVGEIQVRGPWVTGSYYQSEEEDGGAGKFDGDWLRTGDVGSVDSKGFIQITDRAKDVIKSGGEWISSVEVENALMAHENVLEAVVVAIPDERWGERPLACIVPKSAAAVSAEDLQGFLSGKVAKWWVPDKWSFVHQVPKTSVGKFDKKVLRSQHAEGKMTVVDLRP